MAFCRLGIWRLWPNTVRIGSRPVLWMTNVRLSTVIPLPLCLGFLERNFERSFLTTLGFRLSSRGGIT